MPATVEIDVKLVSRNRVEQRKITLNKAVIAGWTGRDKALLQHHIDELGKIGIPPPLKTPTFYRVAISRLTTADAIEVIGDGSSGEVEYVLVQLDGTLWVGAGSDHTDRVFEQSGITLAKQLCDKPIAREFWPLSEVQPHWEKLKIRASVPQNGNEIPYQDGDVAGLLSPTELLARYRKEGHEPTDGMVMFGGTCGAIGGVRHAPRFSFELVDPVLNRRIRHSYAVLPLPIEG